MIRLPKSFGLKLKIVLIALLVVNFAFFSLYLTGEEYTLTETLQSSKDKLSYSLGELLEGYGSGNYKKGKPLSRNKKVLLPASFEFHADTLNHHLRSTSAKNWEIDQLKPSERIEVPPILYGKFFQTDEAKLYNFAKEVPKDQCYLGIGEKLPIVADQVDIIPGTLRNIFEIYLEELDLYNDEYNEDIAPIFADHLRVILEHDLLAPYWYRLSGSSVWLKEYNVHMVVSRLVFSHRRDRVKGDVSLALTQIFDKDWKELKDVRLVFPTNKISGADSPTFHSDGQDFYSHRFPRVVPVPFYHEYKKKGLGLIGPEDPRIFLVQNPKGYEEPVIVYNADQIRMKTNDKGEVKREKTRNMFMTFIFQLQKGKNDVEPNAKADYKYFARTKELMIAGQGRTSKEKNWTPIVSENQEIRGADRYVYFATQLSHLKIIKCDILSDTDSCEVDFAAESSVGDLRGGTPFVNINKLLREQTDYNLRKLIPAGREIWVGVARAHIKNCGCSQNFYRPNLVVLMKDQVTYFDEKANKFVTKGFWKISHVSSFFGMGIEIVPFHPENANSICSDTNALIPNGIGTWQIKEFGHNHGKWYADDVMTLFLSISDYTVDKINIKGLLHSLLDTRDNSMFLNAPFSEPNQHLFQPEVDLKGELKEKLPGFSDTNIQCALEDSKHFCKNYGDEQKENPPAFDPLEVAHAMEKLESKLQEVEEPLKKAGF